MLMLTYNPTPPALREPWNKGKLVGPKELGTDGTGQPQRLIDWQ